jgi:predicted enzyme related to lactoylglutathione lyase
MKVTLLSILVEEQERALRTYRDALGFVLKDDVPMGGARWITLASAEEPDGPRVSLEPAGHPWARDYQRALKQNGVPIAAFAVNDLDAEHERLVRAGIAFKAPPGSAPGMPRMATLDDGCGNWILLYEQPRGQPT